MKKRRILFLYVLLLFVFAVQPPSAYGQRQRLGEAAGITWKQVWLAPGWGIDVPAYWEKEEKLSPGTLGEYRCNEFREFVSLRFDEGSVELMEEAIRTSNAERSKEIMSLFSRLIREAEEKNGEKVIFKDSSIEWVDDFGALLLKYRFEYTDSLSLTFAQYLIPVKNGMYTMTICVDARVLDYIAMNLARRSKTGDLLREKGAVLWNEIGKGYPLPKKTSLVDYVSPYIGASLKIWAVIITALVFFLGTVWLLVRKKRTL